MLRINDLPVDLPPASAVNLPCATALLDAISDHLEKNPLTTVSPHAKGFRKCVGTYLHADGKPRPKIFWLGHQEHFARRCATMLQVIYTTLGQPHWTPESEAAALKMVDAIRDYRGTFLKSVREYLVRETGETAPAPTKPVQQAQALPTKPAAKEPLMLHAAMDRWTAHLDERREAGDLSDDYASRAKSSVKNLKLAMADGPLATIDKAALDRCRLWYQAAMAKPKGAKGRKAWDTAKTECNHARAMFRWFTEQEDWWPEPKRWEKSLSPARTSQADDDRDDEDDGPAVYSVDELVRLYVTANENQKLWLLCGLNFAWGQKEIATARKRHFHELASGRVKVKRRRHKRRRNARAVFAEWFAWPETWELASARMATTPDDAESNPKDLAFLSADGHPLVRRHPQKVDAIKQSFDRLCKTAKVPNHGFYALRATAINMIDDIAGESVGQMMASHRPTSIAGRHYTRRKWVRLHKAMRVMRKRLRPMFEAVKVEEAVAA